MTKLEKLPKGIGGLQTQILQFRTEVRDEFSAVRQEMADWFAAPRQEMRAGDEETRRLMRVLHEDLIGRFALLGDARASGATRRKPK